MFITDKVKPAIESLKTGIDGHLQVDVLSASLPSGAATDSNLVQILDKLQTSSWSVKYEANELPDAATPAWTLEYDPDPLVESVVEINPAGILHISGLGASAEYIDWFIEPAFVSTTGLTVEFRAQMVAEDLLASSSANTTITVEDDDGLAIVEIYSDGVRVTDGVPIELGSYSFDTTDDYHTYRLTKKDRAVKLYIDGVLRISGTVSSSPYSPKLMFSASQGTVDFEQNWDYVYYRTDGAFAPASLSLPTGAATEAKQDTTDDTIVLLRRIVKLLESNAVVDSANRQRISLDSMTAGALTNAGTGVALLGNTVTAGAPTFPGTGYPLYIWEMPVDQRWRVIDAARNTYANSIRSKLVWT